MTVFAPPNHSHRWHLPPTENLLCVSARFASAVRGRGGMMLCGWAGMMQLG
jgi:hypothetical protein